MVEAVWSGADGLHIPFNSVLYVAVKGDVAEVRLWGNVFFCIGAPKEFLDKWYAWLHRDQEDIELEPAPHPTHIWNEESWRQYKAEHRDEFRTKGIDVT